MLDFADIEQIRAMARLEGRDPEKAVWRELARDRQANTIKRVPDARQGAGEGPEWTPREARDAMIRMGVDAGIPPRIVAKAWGLTTRRIQQIAGAYFTRSKNFSPSGVGA